MEVKSTQQKNGESAATKLQDQPKLRQFLQDEFAAVLAVPVDAAGSIHAATIAFYNTESPLAFYFVTQENSEKCTLLGSQESVRAACVVGTYKNTPFTLQMRGQLRITTPPAEIIEAYFAKKGSRFDDPAKPDFVCLQFVPQWARFTDYAQGYKQYWLEV